MLILNASETSTALPYDALIPALAEAFRQQISSPLRHHHRLRSEAMPDAELLLMPAWSDLGFGGVKVANVVADNAGKALPSISASYILFDRQTGRHLMLADGGALTARRTAGASALAASYLARRDARTLLVAGCGRVGRELPHAYRAALGIDRVFLYNRNSRKTEALATDLEAAGFEVEVLADLQTGIAEADIISCATGAKEPILKGEWLRPGQHVDLIGSFTQQTREADDEVMSRGSIFVDTEHALVESGDLGIPLNGGIIQRADIRGTFFTLCNEPGAGRRSADEITVFKSVGTAIEDLAAAVLIYSACTASSQAR